MIFFKESLKHKYGLQNYFTVLNREVPSDSSDNWDSTDLFKFQSSITIHSLEIVSIGKFLFYM